MLNSTGWEIGVYHTQHFPTLNYFDMIHVDASVTRSTVLLLRLCRTCINIRCEPYQSHGDNMNYDQMLRDARSARTLLNRVIAQLENNNADNVSFMIPTQPADIDTLLNFIDKKIGVFRVDMASATDMCRTLKDPRYKEHLMCDAQIFTPVRVGRLFKKIPNTFSTIASRKRNNVRVCIFRDAIRYKTMTSGMLRDEYDSQMRSLMFSGE